jgi:hypothetical protein
MVYLLTESVVNVGGLACMPMLLLSLISSRVLSSLLDCPWIRIVDLPEPRSNVSNVSALRTRTGLRASGHQVSLERQASLVTYLRLITCLVCFSHNIHS